MNRTIYIPLIVGVVSFIIFYGLGLLTAEYVRRRNKLLRSEMKAIQAGLADVAAGRTTPLEEVRQEMRNKWKATERERIQKQEVCSDKSHWKSGG